MFVFFDIDDTLVNHERAARLAALKFRQQFRDYISCSRKEFLARWRKISDKHNDLYLQGKVTLIELRHGRIREFFADTKAPLSNEETDERFRVYQDHYESNLTLFDDVLPCLTRLSHLGVGLISNGDLEQQRRKLEKTDLVDRFVAMVISSEIGVPKPKPGIFLEACRRAGAPPQSCIYVGDRLDVDVLASRAVGMKGVWLNRKQLLSAGLDVPVITTLNGLDKVLANLSVEN